MQYLARSTWTNTVAGFKRYSNRVFDKPRVKGVVLHYPGDGNITRGVLSVAQECGLFRAYRNWHVGNNGWADIGYNVGIGQSGRVYDLAGLTHAAGHAASNAYPRANHDYFGVVLLLGNNERPSAAMVNAINAVLRDLRHSRGFTGMTQVLGHRQVRGAVTACPGNQVMALINSGTFHFSRPAPTPPPPAKNLRPGTVVQVTANRLNTRSGPGTNYSIVGHADRGVKMEVVGSPQGEWVQAQTEWQRRNKVVSWWSVNWLKVVSQPAPPKPSQPQKTYTVKKGDTLGEIAKRFKTSVKALQFLNGIKNPNQIKVGQRLYLVWVVSKGQTLSHIAQRAGTSVNRLKQLNDIKNVNQIEVGQAIRLP